MEPQESKRQSRSHLEFANPHDDSENIAENGRSKQSDDDSRIRDLIAELDSAP